MGDGSTSIFNRESVESRFLLTDVTIEKTNGDRHGKNKSLGDLQLVICHPEDATREVERFPFIEASESQWKVEDSIEILVGIGGVDLTAMFMEGDDMAFFVHLSSLEMQNAAMPSLSGQNGRMEWYNEERQMALSWGVALDSSSVIMMEDPSSSTTVEANPQLPEHLILLASNPGTSEDDTDGGTFFSDLGDVLLHRFEITSNISDIAAAIKVYQKAVDLTPDSHENLPQRLRNLGISFAHRFACEGNPSDIDEAIVAHQRAVDITPGTHVDLPRQLINLGNSFFCRFECRANLSDIDKAIAAYQRAVDDVTVSGHPNLPGWLSNLGLSFTSRFELKGDPADIAEAITAHQRAVDLTPDGHANLPLHLTNLGDSYMTRKGNISDITEAITAYQRAIDLTPTEHPGLPGRLVNLGVSFSYHFQCTADVSDVTEAIAAHQRAVDLTPDGHPFLPGRLIHLGNSFSRRFQCKNDVSDTAEEHQGSVDQGFTPSRRRRLFWFSRLFRRKNGVSGIVEEHQTADLAPGRRRRFARLVSSFFRRKNDVPDTTKAIPQKPVALTSGGHQQLALMGFSFSRRFHRNDSVSDITEAISAYQRAVDLTPDGHPDLPGRLTNLGNSFSRRFQCRNDELDIIEAISAHQKAVNLTLDNHPDLSGFLVNLGLSLLSHFELTEDLSDITESIAAHQRAIGLVPDGHPSLPKWLNNLGLSLSSRFKCTNEVSDITKGISAHRRAIDLALDGDPNLPGWLSNLGFSFSSRFECKGDVSDITEAIAAYQRAVDLTLEGDPYLPEWLSSLGLSFLRRFERNGDLSDVSAAIAANQRAVGFTPDGHDDLSGRLNNLAISFLRRFERKGDLPDITEAIAAHQTAVGIVPRDHFGHAIHLTNLGNSFLCRFERKGDPSDVAEAIAAHQGAVDLTPPGHTNLPPRFANLGNSFMRRFECTGDLSDIAKGIALHRNSIDLITLNDDPNLPLYLTSLGNSYLSRLQRKSNASDIAEAFKALERAVSLTPQHHADRPSRLTSLAQSLYHRSVLTKSSDDVEASIAFSRSAATCGFGPPSSRFGAAKLWAALSYQFHPNSSQTLVAFDSAIHLASLIVGLEDTMQHRYANLNQDLSRFPLQAAAAACSIGRPDKALDWLEEGRCFVWTQLNHLRAPLDAVRLHDEDLAQRLSDVARQLENAGSSRQPLRFEMTMQEKISAEDEAQAHLKLAREWDALVKTVKTTVPGCENFLQSSPSSTLLQDLPKSGPIIIINVHEDRCDAIVLQAGLDKPSSVHLPNFCHKKASDDRNKLVEILKQEGLFSRGDGLVRTMKPMKRKDEPIVDDIRDILENLWKDVLKPILDALKISKMQPGSEGPPPRIWWCPTGPLCFLPIHAAGIHKGANPESVLDYAVSSYTPTATFITSRVKDEHLIDSHRSGLCLISQPHAPGFRTIHTTTKEVTAIHERATKHGVRSLKLEGTAVTVEECLGHMEEFSSIHIACHGWQDKNEPLQSRFLFHKGGLELAAINRKNLKNADSAYLSACQTSTGEEKLAEEAVHLATGMLAAGYRRVVATMWNINDEQALKVATDFYDYILSRRKEGSGDGFDGALSAYALYHATQKLRQKLEKSAQKTDNSRKKADDLQRSLLTWIPYVHFGF